MASNSVLSIISIVCGLAVKILEILSAKGKTNDKSDRISKYTSVSDKLFEDD